MTGPEAIAAAERLLKNIAAGPWTVFEGYDGSRTIATMRSWVRELSVVAPSTWWADDTEPFSEQQREYMARCHAEFFAAAPELVAALRSALLQSQEAQGWQPIETASKDADLLLLYDEGDGVQSGYWHDDANYTGWVCVETQGLTGGRMRPIHWMPLPSPPVAPKAECMCGQQGSSDRYQCHGGGRRCGCPCHSSVAPKER